MGVGGDVGINRSHYIRHGAHTVVGMIPYFSDIGILTNAGQAVRMVKDEECLDAWM